MATTLTGAGTGAQQEDISELERVAYDIGTNNSEVCYSLRRFISLSEYDKARTDAIEKFKLLINQPFTNEIDLETTIQLFEKYCNFDRKSVLIDRHGIQGAKNNLLFEFCMMQKNGCIFYIFNLYDVFGGVLIYFPPEKAEEDFAILKSHTKYLSTILDIFKGKDLDYEYSNNSERVILESLLHAHL